MLADFAQGHLNLVGDLVNAGNFYAVSSAQRVRTANVNADNIINQGLLTNILPAGGVNGYSGFSIVSALQGLKPLLKMTRSTNPRDVRAIAQIMKTAAVLAQLSAAGDAYRQMP